MEIPPNRPAEDMPEPTPELAIVRTDPVAIQTAEGVEESLIVASDRRVPIQEAVEIPPTEASPEPTPEELQAAKDLAECQRLAAATEMPLEEMQALCGFDRLLLAYVRNSLKHTGDEGAAEVGVRYSAVADAVRRIPEPLEGAAHQALFATCRTESIEAVAAIADTPRLQHLADRPDIVASVATAIGSLGKGLFDTNVELLRDMAERGVVDSLVDGYRGESKAKGDPSILFYHPPAELPHKSMADPEWQDAYVAKRELFRELIAMPGFEAVIQSGAAETVMHTFASNFFIDRGLTAEQWQQDTRAFLEAVAEPESLRNFEALAAKNPDACRYLVPEPKYAAASAQDRRDMLTYLAAQEAGVLSDLTLSRVRDLPWEQHLQGLHAIAVCGLAPYAHRGDMSRETTMWLMDPRTGTLAEKKELCKDPLFVGGLERAFSYGIIDRMESLVSERVSDPYIQALVEQGLAAGDRDRLQSGYPDNGHHDTLRRIAADLYTSFYRRYGLDCFDLLEGWEESGHNAAARFDQVRHHLRTMDQLESLHPRQIGEKGVCRTLNDDFCIRHFGRYGLYQLATQYEQRDLAGPHVIVGFASSDFKSRGIERSAENSLPDLKLEVEALTPPRMVRIHEWATPRQAVTTLIRSRRRYGPADLFMGTAHGLAGGRGLKLSEQHMLYARQLVTVQPDQTVVLRTGDRLEGVVKPGAAVLHDVCQAAGLEGASDLSVSDAIAMTLGGMAVAYRDDVYGLLPEVPGVNDDGTLKMSPLFKNAKGAWGSGVTSDGLELREKYNLPPPRGN